MFSSIGSLAVYVDDMQSFVDGSIVIRNAKEFLSPVIEKLIADGYEVHLSMDYDLSSNCGNENWTGYDVLYRLIYQNKIYPDMIYIHSWHKDAERMANLLNNSRIYEKDDEQGGWKKSIAV